MKKPAAKNSPGKNAPGKNAIVPVHLLKIAVGIDSLDHFRERMKVRRKAGKTFTHYTRHMPKRAEEVLAGGSLYWIVKGWYRGTPAPSCGWKKPCWRTRVRIAAS